ncbi:TMAO reductase system protein TorT, partial [Vibrio fortis]
ATHYLRKQPYEFHQVPKIEALTPSSLKKEVIADSLSPSEFRPVFSVTP